MNHDPSRIIRLQNERMAQGFLLIGFVLGFLAVVFNLGNAPDFGKNLSVVFAIIGGACLIGSAILFSGRDRG